MPRKPLKSDADRFEALLRKQMKLRAAQQQAKPRNKPAARKK